MSQLSISGAVSGLDTATIINQLLSIDARQQQLISSRQSSAEKAVSTYSSIISSLESLSKQASNLADTSSWVGTTATSSATSVAVKATGMQAGQLTFAVTSLASTHALVSANTVSSTRDVVASGPLTLTPSGGTAKTIAVGGGTLSEVVTAINKADAGVRATAVLVSPGNYRLQVASTSTGANSSFTLAGITGFSGMNILAQGTDAKIKVGTNPATAYEVTSTTNTFSKVVPGVSFTVSALESSVTVGATVDGSKVADQVSALVDAANSVLSTLDKNTTWDTTTKTGGPLFGESAARRLRSAILSVVGSASAPGVETTRTGRLSFDRSEFLDAFADDPDAVAEQYGATTTFAARSGVTAGVELTSVTDATRAGTYAISLTQAPVREKWEIELPADMDDLIGQTIVLGKGSTSVSFEVTTTMTAAALASQLNSRAATAGLAVGAAAGSGKITLTATDVGAGGAFTADVEDDQGDSTGVASRVATGTDVAGTIDGLAAKGSGSVLHLTKGTSGAVGLAVSVNTSATGAIGSVSVKAGLAQSLLGMIEAATDSETGYLAIAKDGQSKAVEDLQSQYDSWTRRLEMRRTTLTRQFTAMETALSSMQNQLGFLLSRTSGS